MCRGLVPAVVRRETQPPLSPGIQFTAEHEPVTVGHRRVLRTVPNSAQINGFQVHAEAEAGEVPVEFEVAVLQQAGAQCRAAAGFFEDRERAAAVEY